MASRPVPGEARSGSARRPGTGGQGPIQPRSRWKTLTIIATLLVGLGLLAYALFGGSTDEERILALLSRVERVATIQPGDNIAARSLRLRGELAELFEKDVEVDFAETGAGVNERDELIGLVAQADLAVESLEAHFTGLKVVVEGTGVTAHVTGNVTVDAVKSGGQPDRAERPVRFDLIKGKDGWRISRARVSAPPDDE